MKKLKIAMAVLGFVQVTNAFAYTPSNKAEETAVKASIQAAEAYSHLSCVALGANLIDSTENVYTYLVDVSCNSRAGRYSVDVTAVPNGSTTTYRAGTPRPSPID